MGLTNESLWIRFYRSKFFLAVVLGLVVFVGFSVVKERREQQTNKDRVDALRQEVADLSGKNTELAQMIKYFQSEEYVEREAREKLNLQKPGEKVVIVPEENGLRGAVMGDGDEMEKHNWEKWIDYFFGMR